MLTIYKRKEDIPQQMELIELNDIFFNQYTSRNLDDKAKNIIKTIDKATWKEPYKIISGLNGEMVNIDKLSSGCKTALNVCYNPDKVFSLKECGNNALDVIYAFDDGNLYCEYAIISFKMEEVMVQDGVEKRKINSYQELKEWWEDV